MHVPESVEAKCGSTRTGNTLCNEVTKYSLWFVNMTYGHECLEDNTHTLVTRSKGTGAGAPHSDSNVLVQVGHVILCLN